MLGGGDDSKDGLMDLTYSPARERRVVIGLRGVVLWFCGLLVVVRLTFV